jgi:hypothetical protein
MRRSAAVLASAGLLAGCNVMEPVSLGEQACTHVEIAGTAIDAADDPAAGGEAVVEVSGEPYTVGLPDGAPGYVRIQLLEETDAVLFVGAAGVVRSLSECGCEQPMPDPAPDGFCPEAIPEHYHLHLAPGTYHLELESDEPDGLWLMLAPLEETHGHDHEH